MTRILVIDDEPINHELVGRALEPMGAQLEFASNGNEGIAKARLLKPDAIVTDVMMPDITGYELTRILRRESHFADKPILILTAQSGLEDKLQAFEAGADDHLTKPFEGAELLVRLTSLLRRAAAAGTQRQASVQLGHLIAVHSLRGGTGSSTIAVNVGIALQSLWSSTILLDLVMTAGQVPLMLNQPLRRTWSDLATYDAGELDLDVLQSVSGSHESGLAFIAAPTLPAEATPLQSETMRVALDLLRRNYDYVVADLSHDFSEITLQALDAADIILLVTSPDMSSLRAAFAALDTYKKLGYEKEKIKLILNATFSRSGLSKDKIESALDLQASVVIPYTETLLVEAINFGRPPVHDKPNEPFSALLEDLAFHLSRSEHKKTKPADPSEAWKRVYKRYQERRR